MTYDYPCSLLRASSRRLGQSPSPVGSRSRQNRGRISWLWVDSTELRRCPLERFLNFAVFDIHADLRNRTLHIRWNETLRQNVVSGDTKRQNDVLETPLSFSARLSLKEMAVVRLIASDSKISIASITTKTGLSRRTVDRVIAALKEKGILSRDGAKNIATWIVKIH